MRNVLFSPLQVRWIAAAAVKTDEQRGGLTSCQFVRYGLLRLRLGDDLTHITTGKATRRPIAPAEEVLALYPDLATPG